MTTEQTLTATARRLGFRPTIARTETAARFTALDQEGNIRVSADIINGRFASGYTVDRFANLVSCSTVRELTRFMAW